MSAADAETALTPAPEGNWASVPSSSRRSSGAAVEYSASVRAPYGLASGPRLPIKAGRLGRSSQLPASSCQRSAVGSAVNRSVATVGAQYGPSPVAGSGSGIPLAIKPAAAATSRIRPSRDSSMPVVLLSRLTSRIPSPPLRSSETGAAASVSIRTSSSRSRSMVAPAAAASTSSAVVVDTTGSGAVSCMGPACSPRSTCPTWRGRITVSASMRRSSPIASSWGTGRSVGAPGAASRVRPIGEPSRSFSSTSSWAWLRSSMSRAISSPVRAASSRVTWPGYQGSAVPASGAMRSAVSPQTNARARRSSSASAMSASRARSPINASSFVVGTGVASACSTNSASSTASRRKSSSSVAALTDWRA